MLMAMILAGGRGDRLSILSQERAKPAVVFGGKYRIIDFTLSNCVYSGIYRVALLTQYRPRSLNGHIGTGRSWDLDRMKGGIFLLQPYLGRRASDWYKNTADAVYQNLSFVHESRADHVLVLAGDHVYRMRYDALFQFHQEKGADCTVGTVRVPLEEASRYGIMTVNRGGRIVDFVEKPSEPPGTVASMGIYLFNKDALVQVLEEDARRTTSRHDFGGDVIPAMLKGYKVYSYPFAGYWRDIGTVEAYRQANMDLLSDPPEFNLYDPDEPVLTQAQNRSPARTGPRAQITRSLVCDGCIVNGVVRNSVLSPGVYVEEGAVVEESVVFDDCLIGQRAHVHRAILDKEVRVGGGAHIGWGDDYTPNEDEPTNLDTGITLVGKRAEIPPSTRIGRNCKIYPGTQAKNFPSDTIASGQSVGKT